MSLAEKLKEKSADFHEFIEGYFEGLKDASEEEIIERTEEVTITLLSTIYNSSYLLHMLSKDKIEMREELAKFVDLGIADAYGFFEK